MSATNLIFIDGILGSGKSTTAQWLWLRLIRNNHDAQWFYEHDTTHPIWHLEEQKSMVETGVIEPSFLDDVILSRWGELAAALTGSDKITILESTLLQTTVGFLAAMNLDNQTIKEHVRKLEHAIAGLHPALIYFYQNDVAAALQAICEDRRNDEFDTALIELLGGTPYGKSNQLNDFDGVVRFYQHCREIYDSLLADFPSSKLAIENSGGDWSSYKWQITRFLGLPEMEEICTEINQPARYLGRYKDADSEDALVVAGDERGLYLDDARCTRLIHKSNNTFYVESMCLELSFEEPSRESFQRIKLRGNLPGLHPIWERE